VTGFQTSDVHKFESIWVAMGRRFPENICNLKLSEFCDQVEKSLKLTVKISDYSVYFAVWESI